MTNSAQAMWDSAGLCHAIKLMLLKLNAISASAIHIGVAIKVRVVSIRRMIFIVFSMVWCGAEALAVGISLYG